MRKRLAFLAKLALGLGMLVWLLVWDDAWRTVLDLFSDIRPVKLIPLVGIVALLVGASCLKWGLLLRERGLRIPFQRLFSLYLMGYFFNNFMPSSVGGDIARAYYLGRRIRSQTESFAAVVLERLTGLMTLVGLAVIAFALTPALREDGLVAGSIALLAGGCAVLLVALWRPALSDGALARFDRLRPVAALRAKLRAFHGALEHFWGRRKLVAKTLLYSLLFHLLTVVNVWCAAFALDIDLNVQALFAVTPIILVIASLPLTPNGLGVWEWAFSVYLSPAGAGLEQGLAVALLLRAQTLAVSVVGGFFFLIENQNARLTDDASGG